MTLYGLALKNLESLIFASRLGEGAFRRLVADVTLLVRAHVDAGLEMFWNLYE